MKHYPENYRVAGHEKGFLEAENQRGISQRCFEEEYSQ
jgi:hypothetical protein